jgi:hypothetical protein
MKYGISDEYITDNFIKIAKEMEELKGKIQWESDECNFSSNLPDATSLCNYLNEGFIKDNEQNQKIMDTLESLEEKLYDEGRKISKKIIEAKQKIPICLNSNAEEQIQHDLEQIQEKENLKLDDLSLKEKIKLYFKLFDNIGVSYVQNPYFILEKDIEEDGDTAYAYLDKEYYEVTFSDST